MKPYLYSHHRIADGRIVRASALARAVAKCRKVSPDAYVGTTLRGHMGHAKDLLREFGDFISAEIARRSGDKPRGRKDCPDWFFAARRVADKINGRRIVCHVNECPRELRSRLAHRLHPDFCP